MKGFFLPCCLSCVPSLKAENIQGFVNEMDAVALCLQRITQLGFLRLLLCPLLFSSGDFPDLSMLESSYHHLANLRGRQLTLMLAHSVLLTASVWSTSALN